MINELTLLLSGRGRSNKGCCNPVLYMEVAPTIHQAISVYMRWVILGMELEYQAQGYIHLT